MPNLMSKKSCFKLSFDSVSSAIDVFQIGI
jgi:hypothetical protein